MHRVRLPLLLPCCLVLVCTVAAHAQDPPQPRSLSWNPAPRDQPDPPSHPYAARKHGEQRPFVFTYDPSTPLAGETSVELSMQGASGVQASRPLPSTVAAHGLVYGLTASYGATRWLAPFVTGLVGQRADGSHDPASTVQAGLRWQLTPPDASLRLGAATAYTREFDGAHGVLARMSLSYDIDRIRLAGNAHIEKVFAAGRDSVDLLAFGGVSVRAYQGLRLGAEYVAQDLEDAFEREEAEGGARHYAGPVASLELADGTLWLTGGPAFGINRQSQPLIGRVSMIASF